MNESFAFSEVVRKLANLIRLGKISEIDGDKVRVQIGRVKTGWLPIISMAGESICWTPISIGEQVAVFSPYGESAQAFVLRSIHYNDFPVPENKNAISVNAKHDVNVVGKGQAEVSFDHGLNISCGNSSVNLSQNGVSISSGNGRIQVLDDSIVLSTGDAVLSVSGGGISLSYGSSTIDLSSGSIDLSSGSISTNPAVCKCQGGV